MKRRLNKRHRFTLPDGSPLRINDGEDFPCPWCGAVCTASLAKCAVLHPTPPCDEYMRDENGPVEILQAANAKLRKERLS